MKKRIFILIGLISILVIISILTFNLLNLSSYRCPCKEFLNFYCIGCGTTRMINSILNLDIYQAFRYNPLMFIYFILIVVYGFLNSYSYIKKNKLIPLSTKTIAIFGGIAIIFMVLRNISIFDFLAPTTI